LRRGVQAIEDFRRQVGTRGCPDDGAVRIEHELDAFRLRKVSDDGAEFAAKIGLELALQGLEVGLCLLGGMLQLVLLLPFLRFEVRTFRRAEHPPGIDQLQARRFQRLLLGGDVLPLRLTEIFELLRRGFRAVRLAQDPLDADVGERRTLARSGKRLENRGRDVNANSPATIDFIVTFLKATG
jgi:hypothetical protein